MTQAQNIADELSRALLNEGVLTGQGWLSTKPHFAVLDPVVNCLTSNITLSEPEYKVDASEGHGEVEYFTPERAQAFIEMPDLIQKLQTHIQEQDRILQGFSKNIELHLKVEMDTNAAINELRDAIKELKSNVRV
jgi:hypothetical protein